MPENWNPHLYTRTMSSERFWNRSLLKSVRKSLRAPNPEQNAKVAIHALDSVGGWDDYAPTVEVLVDEVLVSVEEGVVEDIREAAIAGAEIVLVQPTDNHQFYRFAAVVAREVKVKMGTPTLSAANWLVAQDLVGKVLAEKHVRKVDRVKFSPLATQMVFVPTKYDVHAAEFMRTQGVADRQNAFLGNSKATWWEWVWGLKKPWKPPMMMRG